MTSYSSVIRRGDASYFTGDAATPASSPTSSHHVVLFLNPLWRKNSYGELIFHDGDVTGGSFSDFAHVAPRHARVVTWAGDTPMYVRPPAAVADVTDLVMAYFQFYVTSSINGGGGGGGGADELEAPVDNLMFEERKVRVLASFGFFC